MDTTLLQRIIDGFRQSLEPGLGNLRPFLLWWVGVFVLLESVRVFGQLMEDGRAWKHGVGFVIRTGLFASIYAYWPTIMKTLIDDFTHAGLRMMGSTLTVEQILDPGSLVRVGLSTATPLKNILMANLGVTSIVQGLAFLVAWLLYLMAYAWMALGVFLAQIEIAVVMPLSLLALGFLFWGPTRQMAGGVLSYTLNMAFRFFLTAVLTSMVFRLAPILFPDLPSATAFDLAIEQAFCMVVAALVLAYLFTKLPAVVAHHLAGTPTLTAGGFLQTGAGLLALGASTTTLLRTHSAAWNLRRPTPLQLAASGGSAAQTRMQAPQMPALHTMTHALRMGAQYLGHDQSGPGGVHVNP